MIPSYWSYELIEAWYPGTIWNPEKNIVIFSDWEGFEGRTTYPDIGGCWFASRLSVSQKLVNERRQAAIIVLREAHPGYIMPVGVWNVRLHVKETLKNKPLLFNTLKESLQYISTKLDVPLIKWIENSYLLRQMLFQKKLSDFSKTTK
jgi:hypothetical protein